MYNSVSFNFQLAYLLRVVVVAAVVVLYQNVSFLCNFFSTCRHAFAFCNKRTVVCVFLQLPSVPTIVRTKNTNGYVFGFAFTCTALATLNRRQMNAVIIAIDICTMQPTGKWKLPCNAFQRYITIGSVLKQHVYHSKVHPAIWLAFIEHVDESIKIFW